MTLKTLLRQRGYDPSRPLLVSLDCDRTLVDRSRGPHWVSPLVAEAFHTLQHNPNLLVVINTGRDATAYQPLQPYFGEGGLKLFLSGRVRGNGAKLSAHPDALLSHETLCGLTDFCIKHQVPYLDVKHAAGNIIWRREKVLLSHFCPFKPIDWMHALHPEIRSMAELEEGALLAAGAVRVEVPIQRDAESSLFALLQNRQMGQLREQLQTFLPVEDLEILPIPSRRELFHDVITLRVMCSNRRVNKGVALKELGLSLAIPESNIIAVGDSNDETAGDCVIKTELPGSLLCTLGAPPYPNIDLVFDEASKDGIIPLMIALSGV